MNKANILSADQHLESIQTQAQDKALTPVLSAKSTIEKVAAQPRALIRKQSQNNDCGYKQPQRQLKDFGECLFANATPQIQKLSALFGNNQENQNMISGQSYPEDVSMQSQQESANAAEEGFMPANRSGYRMRRLESKPMTPAPGALKPLAPIFPVDKSECYGQQVSHQIRDIDNEEECRRGGYANDEMTMQSQTCNQDQLTLFRPMELQGDGRRREVKRNKIHQQVTNEELELENAIRQFQDSNPKIAALEQQLDSLKLLKISKKELQSERNRFTAQLSRDRQKLELSFLRAQCINYHFLLRKLQGNLPECNADKDSAFCDCCSSKLKSCMKGHSISMNSEFNPLLDAQNELQIIEEESISSKRQKTEGEPIVKEKQMSEPKVEVKIPEKTIEKEKESEPEQPKTPTAFNTSPRKKGSSFKYKATSAVVMASIAMTENLFSMPQTTSNNKVQPFPDLQEVNVGCEEQDDPNFGKPLIKADYDPENMDELQIDLSSGKGHESSMPSTNTLDIFEQHLARDNVDQFIDQQNQFQDQWPSIQESGSKLIDQSNIIARDTQALLQHQHQPLLYYQGLANTENQYYMLDEQKKTEDAILNIYDDARKAFEFMNGAFRNVHSTQRQ